MSVVSDDDVGIIPCCLKACFFSFFRSRCRFHPFIIAFDGSDATAANGGDKLVVGPFNGCVLEDGVTVG